MRVHKLQNVQTALSFLQKEKKVWSPDKISALTQYKRIYIFREREAWEILSRAMTSGRQRIATQGAVPNHYNSQTYR